MKSLIQTTKPPSIKGAQFKRHVADPPRYPKVINGYEDEALEAFNVEIKEMYVDVVKKIVDYAKQ